MAENAHFVLKNCTFRFRDYTAKKTILHIINERKLR